MTEKVTHKVEDQEVTVFANEEDEQAPSQPFKTFNSKNEHDAYLEAALKERLERKDRKLAEEKEKTEREAREAALKDQENWKQLAEERTNTITEKDKRIEELQSLEGERDTHKERAETLEARLSGLIKPQLEAVPELFRHARREAGRVAGGERREAGSPKRCPEARRLSSYRKAADPAEG
jgi:myosin heavy subunit